MDGARPGAALDAAMMLPHAVTVMPVLGVLACTVAVVVHVCEPPLRVVGLDGT